jgi:hypothetical protein
MEEMAVIGYEHTTVIFIPVIINDAKTYTG